MPTNPTLPTLDGEPRELRDGDRVRLRCGIDVTIESNGVDLDDEECWWSGEPLCSAVDYTLLAWSHAGVSAASRETDIVLILGPAEHENGYGTVTKVCTIPVRAEHGLHERICCFNAVAPDNDAAKYAKAEAHLCPKPPTPSPFEVELARRLNLEDWDAEKVVLPRTAVGLEISGKEWVWSLRDLGVWPSSPELFGPLPDRQQFPGPDTIQLDAVRRLAQQQEPTMTNQPSPVLTAEERKLIDLVRHRFDLESEAHGVSSSWAATCKTRAETLSNLLSRTADPDTVTLNMEQAESVLSVALHACVTGDCEHDDVRDCGNELAKFIDVALRRTNIDDMLFGAIKNYYDRKSGEQAPAIPQAEKAREIIERAEVLIARVARQTDVSVGADTEPGCWWCEAPDGEDHASDCLGSKLLADIAAYKEG